MKDTKGEGLKNPDFSQFPSSTFLNKFFTLIAFSTIKFLEERTVLGVFMAHSKKYSPVVFWFD